MNVPSFIIYRVSSYCLFFIFFCSLHDFHLSDISSVSRFGLSLSRKRFSPNFWWSLVIPSYLYEAPKAFRDGWDLLRDGFAIGLWLPVGFSDLSSFLSGGSIFLLLEEHAGWKLCSGLLGLDGRKGLGRGLSIQLADIHFISWYVLPCLLPFCPLGTVLVSPESSLTSSVWGAGRSGSLTEMLEWERRCLTA